MATVAVCILDPAGCKQCSGNLEAAAVKRRVLNLKKQTGKAGTSLRQATFVARYDVFAVCKACGDPHRTEISIKLLGRVKRRTIAEAYRGKQLPHHLATLKQAQIYCPLLRRHYPQTDYRQFLLVPSTERVVNERIPNHKVSIDRTRPLKTASSTRTLS